MVSASFPANLLANFRCSLEAAQECVKFRKIGKNTDKKEATITASVLLP
jgi:hypothetical protein